MAALTRRRTGAVVLALVALSALVRFLAARSVPLPWIAPDEMTYGLLGRSLYADGDLDVLGGPTGFYSFLYPALVGGPLSLSDLDLGFTILQAVQAVVVSSTAAFVYLWGRSFLSRRWALAAAALTLTAPALAYAGDVMTEALYLPVATLAAWTLARALEEPSLQRQLLFVAALAAAGLTRLQAVVFLPVLLTALVLVSRFARDARVVRRFVPTLVLLGALALAWSAWHLRDGGPWTKVLGAYGAVGAEPYHVGEAAKFAVWHVADLALIVAGVPLLALLVLCVEGYRDRLPSRAAQTAVAVSIATAAWLAVEVGIFASRHVGRLAERDLITFLPLGFLALALWLELGAPRPQPATSIIGLLVAAPLLVLPIADLATLEAEPDAFMMIPFRELADAWGTGGMEAAWYVLVVAFVLAFVLVPRRFAPALAIAVGVALVSASVVTSREVGRLAQQHEHRYFGGAERSWIDDAADGPVAILYDGSGFWPSVWQQVFWNDSVRHVLRPPEIPVPGPVPQVGVAPRFDGHLFTTAGRPVDTRLVVAPTSITFAASKLATLTQNDIDRAGLALWRSNGPPRVATWATGFMPNGDVEGDARIVVYGCRPGHLAVTFLGKDQLPIELLADGVPVARRTLNAGEVWNASVPAPAGADGSRSCTFDVASEGLVGTTRVEYVPG